MHAVVVADRRRQRRRRCAPARAATLAMFALTAVAAAVSAATLVDAQAATAAASPPMPTAAGAATTSSPQQRQRPPRRVRRLARRDVVVVDHGPMTGKAVGRRAGGHPDPVPGLANPDAPALTPNRTASMEDLVLPFGYPLETYPVETPDGFVLRLYRIPYGRANATKPGGKRPAVLLHHGVTLSSACFVVLDPQSSMGFYLADAGFDVWMANTRANTFSRGHRHHRATDEAYWQHSMDELALLDLPAQIDFVLNATGRSSLALVGHSQGCTLPLMLLAQRPEYNAKLWLLLLLGPVTFGDKIRAPFLQASARFDSVKFLSGMGAGQFVPNGAATAAFVKGCTASLEAQRYCADVSHFVFFGFTNRDSPRDFARIAATWPATVAVRNLMHWTQLSRRGAGVFMFDFGGDCAAAAAVGGADGADAGGAGAAGTASGAAGARGGAAKYDAHGRALASASGDSGSGNSSSSSSSSTSSGGAAAGSWPVAYLESCNLAKYGQRDPPQYDLTRVTAKTAVFEGEIDVMATREDVTQLRRAWRADVVAERVFNDTAHMDFIWARRPYMKRDVIDVLWANARL